MEFIEFDRQGILKFLMYLVGISVFLVILFRTINNIKEYFIVLFVLKPFIDMTKFATIISLGGMQFTLLDITGFLTFLVAIAVLVKTPLTKIYNRSIIIIFISLHIFWVILSFITGLHKIISDLEFLIRLITPYLIYFIFYQYIETEKQRIDFARKLWMANLGAASINLIIILLGFGLKFYSRGGYRYAGLYGDAYTYFAVALFSLIFGIYFLEKSKSTGYILNRYKLIYGLNIIIAGAAFNITLQKTMALALFMFVLLWWGIHKRKIALILPLLVIVAVYYYLSNEYFQARIGPEVDLASRLTSGEQIAVDDLRSFGTGRGSRWIDYIYEYIDNFSLGQKLFGAFIFSSYHSQYFAVLMQVGLIGLTIFGVMIFRFIVALFSNYYRTNNTDYFLGFLLFVTVLIFGVSQPSFFMTTVMWYTMSWLSILNSNRKFE